MKIVARGPSASDKDDRGNAKILTDSLVDACLLDPHTQSVRANENDGDA